MDNWSLLVEILLRWCGRGSSSSKLEPFRLSPVPCSAGHNEHGNVGQGKANRPAGVLSGMWCGDVVALNGPDVGCLS
jgi:hypothetical protein